MKYSAPALHQGIMLLDVLNEHGQMSLENIAKLTLLSKSTALRLLDTLDKHGWVKRDPVSKRYESLVAIGLKSDFNFFSEEILNVEIEKLAFESGCTAEWYLPRADGMEIVNRSEPINSSVFVKARIGFLRKFNEEFDAVNRIAAKCGLHLARKKNKSICYAKLGMDSISSKEIPSLLEEIDESFVTYDVSWNKNGIRRFAIGICDIGKKLIGIFALAEPFTPDAELHVSSRIALLKKLKFKLEALDKL